MTEKLYYADPEMLEFDAAVLRAVPVDGGRCEVVLDRSGFYPGGGGQPPDRGALGGIPVLDVREEEDGTIVHVLERPLPAGGRIAGTVDAARRRDFMAQHTGEHLFAQALLRAGGLQTVSVHFGDDDTTIELKSEGVDDRILRGAEEIANAVIRENRRVIVHEVDRSEASRFTLRRAPPEEQRLRIVEVEGFDWVGCSGVHVRSTAQVFLIKAVSQERIRGRVRLHMQIGSRAFEDYGRKIALSQALGRALTCGEDSILARVQDLQAAQLEAAREIRRLTAERAAADADAAVSSGRRAGAAVLVRRSFEKAGPDYLKAFVERVTAAPGRACVAVDRGADSFQWIVAHSLGNGLELSTIVSPRMAEAGAKGGGRGARMQGVGARADAMEAFARAVEEDLLAFLGRQDVSKEQP